MQCLIQFSFKFHKVFRNHSPFRKNKIFSFWPHFGQISALGWPKIFWFRPLSGILIMVLYRLSESSEIIWFVATFATFRPSGGRIKGPNFDGFWSLTATLIMEPTSYVVYILVMGIFFWVRWPYFGPLVTDKWLQTVLSDHFSSAYHWIHFILVKWVLKMIRFLAQYQPSGGRKMDETDGLR